LLLAGGLERDGAWGKGVGDAELFKDDGSFRGLGELGNAVSG
jgi:hypothetical protein